MSKIRLVEVLLHDAVEYESRPASEDGLSASITELLESETFVCDVERSDGLRLELSGEEEPWVAVITRQKGLPADPWVLERWGVETRGRLSQRDERELVWFVCGGDEQRVHASRLLDRGSVRELVRVFVADDLHNVEGLVLVRLPDL